MSQWRSSCFRNQHSTSHPSTSSASASVPRRITRASTSNPAQKPARLSRKRQASPASQPRPTKRRHRAPVSQRAFRPPSIHEISDSDDESSNTGSERSINGDGYNGNDEGENQGDIDDHLLNSDPNQVQSMLNSEAIQIVAEEGNSEENHGDLPHNRQHHQERQNNHQNCRSRYQTEVPRWSSSPGNLLRNEQSDDEGEVIQAIYLGARLISLRSQSPELRQVIAHGEKVALKQALSNSFFSINDSGYTALTTMLEKVATDLNFPRLVEAFQQDKLLVQNAARVINHRLTLCRSKIKRIAETFVGFFFGFDNSDASPETIQTRVNELNLKSAYIFSIDDNGSINKNKPYEHPVIIRTLRKFLFDDGARKSTLGENNFEIFSSNSSDVPQMPVGLVCLAATGVHAAISDWSTGVYKRSDFVVDIVEDVYTGHQEFLKVLEKRSPPKFNALLHCIYMMTKAYLPTIGHTIAQGLSEIVDFNGMQDLDRSSTMYEASGPSSAGSFSLTVSQEL